MRRLALANGIVDWPDLKRKAHVEPVAYLGGVAVFLGWVAGIVVSYFIQPHTSPAGAIDFPASVLFGAFIIMLAGLFDDVYGISPRVKIGGQLLAAAALAAEQQGTRLAAGLIASITGSLGFDAAEVIPGFGADPHYLDPSYWLGAILVTVFVLGGCNAANLLDGLDGLASGVTAIVAAGFTFISAGLAMGLFTGEPYSVIYDPVRVVICLALLGAVLGFLPYNFNPANIFMGDAGSMLLGYLCVSIILLFAEKGSPLLVMAGLFVFALPIIDTAMAIVRRKARGQPVFSPDNQHLHHQLIRAGMSVKQAVGVLYIMAFGFAVLGSSLIFFRLRYVAGIFIVVCAFVVVTAYKVGHRQYLLTKASEGETGGDTAPPTEDAAAPPVPPEAASTASSDTSS
jgi:UDP-GlcNAc:undecaprenyl-phosphate GlcNAc-1-phosphate transferase